MKKYSKKKDDSKTPNATGPKYRTSDYFRGSKFGKGQPPKRVSFNPTAFKKTQHKG